MKKIQIKHKIDLSKEEYADFKKFLEEQAEQFKYVISKSKHFQMSVQRIYLNFAERLPSVDDQKQPEVNHVKSFGKHGIV